MRVSVVTQLCNRGRNFTRMLETMPKALGIDDELVVVDYTSDDCDVAGLLNQYLPGRHYLVQQKRPFRLCRGYNVGAHVAKGDIVFYTHADVLHPEGACDLVASKVEPGQVFFPIIGWLQKHGGAPYWSPGAFGTLGVMRDELLPWNETMDGHWGYQDNDLFNRYVNRGFKIVREKMDGMLHIHHDTRREYLEKYYPKGKNRVEPDPYPTRT